MCELTFINSHNELLNKYFTLLSGLENSRTPVRTTLPENIHGWGIFTQKSGILKTVVTPWDTLNFGTIIKNRVDKRPVLLHVRAASKNTEVKEEFNHPFETENLILAHNGTLIPKVSFTNEAYKNMMDTQVFLQELDKVYVSNGKTDLVESLQKTMLMFYGKFAFLIYEKNTGDYYAVRGFSATLNLVYILDPEGNNIGYVVNTVNEDLYRSMETVYELLDLQGKQVPGYSRNIALPTETIFKLNDTEVVDVGKLVQNSAPTTTAIVPAKSASIHSTNYKPSYDSGTATPAMKEADQLAYWLRIYGLNIEDLDEILYQTLGVRLLECDPTDIQTLHRFIFPKLITKKAFKEDVKDKISSLSKSVRRDLYGVNKFSYPYMLIDGKDKQKKFVDALNKAFSLKS